MRRIAATSFLSLLIILSGCKETSTKGKLFIIGGGERTLEMMKELTALAGVNNGGYVYILPMASSVPDSSVIWTAADFEGTGVGKISGYNFAAGTTPPQPQLDSVRKAKLIFISGGDQARFMDAVKNTAVYDAIWEAYRNGAVIAGTSAGAAVMSKKMITGNQMKHPDPESGFKTIEEGNVEIKEGMGFLNDIIIDQHFIKRQRLNRLISVSIENPAEPCIGIDESTAIIIEGNKARVTGVNQVVVLKNKSGKKNTLNGLLGNTGLELAVYLPGQTFNLR